MRCLVRYITRKTKGGITHEDKSFEGAVLTVGRATDQHVFLPDLRVALEHARITMGKDGKFVVHSESVSGILVNDRSVQTARLTVGDVIGIGGCRLVVAEPPAGYDVQLDVEVPKPGRDQAPSRLALSPMSLAATGLSKRRWSWGLLFFIAFFFLFLPLAGFFVEPLQATLRDVPGLPSDAVWETGELAKPHHFIGSDCNACHQIPFVMAQDEACVACHKRTPQHADPHFYELETLTATRCASCHKDHNGPTGLIRNDDKLCADCHSDLATRVAEIGAQTALFNASDFRADHPQFRPTFTVHLDEEGNFRGDLPGERRPLDVDDWPVERSGLKFNHAVHLDSEGLRAPEGKVVLQCESCHLTEPGGGYMLPVTMDGMCQRCHELNFDATDPERQAPHGDMRAVVYTLQEYYGLRALQGGYDDPEVPEVVRRPRRPGERLSESERRVALAWADQKWREVAEDMIELRTCGTCHYATQVRDDPPLWKIWPVRVAEVWMPKARFSHGKHATESCDRCHEQAWESETAEDVILPRIEICTECHGGAHDRDLLPSTCIDCHGFHVYQDVLMGAVRSEASDGIDAGLLPNKVTTDNTP